MVVNCVYPLEFVGRQWRTLTGTIGFWAIGEMMLALIVSIGCPCECREENIVLHKKTETENETKKIKWASRYVGKQDKRK